MPGSSFPDYFDLVYIDAEKDEYKDYYELVLPRVKSGGFILADNVLWGGKVLKITNKTDHFTRGIIAFNKKKCMNFACFLCVEKWAGIPGKVI